MTAEELLAQVEELGIVLKPEGDRLLYRPVEAVQPELLAQLRTHKSELLDLLTWPEECLAAEREHGHPCARLFPFVGQRVTTSLGQGRLIEILPERAVVALDQRPDQLVALLPGEVGPPDFDIRGETLPTMRH